MEQSVVCEVEKKRPRGGERNQCHFECPIGCSPSFSRKSLCSSDQVYLTICSVVSVFQRVTQVLRVARV